MLWEKRANWLYDLEGRRGVQLGLATEITDYLRDDSRSPWFGRIKRVAEPRDEDQLIPDKLKIRSLVEVLKDRVFEGFPVNELADMLIDYWNAIL